MCDTQRRVFSEVLAWECTEEWRSRKYMWELINDKSGISSQLEKDAFPDGASPSGKNKGGSLLPPLPSNKFLMYQISKFFLMK